MSLICRKFSRMMIALYISCQLISASTLLLVGRELAINAKVNADKIVFIYTDLVNNNLVSPQMEALN